MAGLANDPADLYGLTVEQLVQLERFAETRPCNPWGAIAASRARPLSRLLVALGVRHVGPTGARAVARAFGTLEAIEAASVEELAAVDGVGGVIAASLAEFLSADTNVAVIGRLRVAGVSTEEPGAAGVAGGGTDAVASLPQTLAGKVVVVTGAVPGYTREGAEEAIMARGGTSPGSVSKKTFALVVGDVPGRLERPRRPRTSGPRWSTRPRSTRCSKRANSRSEAGGGASTGDVCAISSVGNAPMPLITDSIGRVLGKRYRLLSALGTGASAHVFLAEDVSLQRLVAVKVLQPGLATDNAFLKRFRAEARSVASLNHPHVLRVFDWGEDTDGPYLVLEYLGGGSLRDLLDRDVRLTHSQAAQLGAEVAQGLAYAHVRGLVHRDIKPANLLFDEESRVRVADFGVARALAEAAWTEPAGAMVGTARYISPEAAEGTRSTGVPTSTRWRWFSTRRSPGRCPSSRTRRWGRWPRGSASRSRTTRRSGPLTMCWRAPPHPRPRLASTPPGWRRAWVRWPPRCPRRRPCPSSSTTSRTRRPSRDSARRASPS